MRILLEDFWYGNVLPHEQYMSHNPDVKEVLRLTEKIRLNLSETLTEVQKEALQKYDDAVTEMNDIMERELFIYAFRLGGRFMLETLSNER